MTPPFEHAVLLQFRAPVRNTVEDVFYEIFDIVFQLYAEIIGVALRIDPTGLDSLEQIYAISMAAYFGLLSVFALASIGLFQLFPGDEKMDPQRFLRRALPATLSLWIVNPPGSGGTFTRGAFAWAIRLTNTLIELFLSQLGTNIGFSATELGGALSGPFLMLGVGVTMGSALALVELILLLMLVIRQFAIYLTYAIYPLLIVFWVADMGPLKYVKQLSMKFLKMAVLLLAGGVLVAGILTVGLGLITATDGLFAGGGSVIYRSMFKLAVLSATSLLPILVVYQMLGPVGDAVMSAVSAGVDAGILVASGVLAVATGGTSSVATTAAHGGISAAKTAGTQVAKQGVKTAVKQAGKTALKKGTQAASKQTLSKGASAAKSVGKRAVEKGPEAAKRVGKRAASEGSDTAQSMTQEALAGAPEPIDDPEADPQAPESQSSAKRTSKPSSPSTSNVGTATSNSGKSGLPALYRQSTASSQAPTNPGLDGSADSKQS